MSSETTYVYIMARKNPDGLAGPCKVGVTSGLSGRLEQIRTASPFEVVLASWFPLPCRSVAQELEHSFHDFQGHKRLHGEWFDLEPERATNLMLSWILEFLEHRLHLKGEKFDQMYDQAIIHEDKWAV